MKYAALFLLLLLLSGCGHNTVTYGDGVQAELGLIPDQYKVAMAFRYGKIFTAAVKEKAKVTLTTKASGSGTVDKAGQKADIVSEISITTGDHIKENKKVEAAAGGTSSGTAE